MKTIELDDELYQYIASQTQQIGESASDILRRLLNVESGSVVVNVPQEKWGNGEPVTSIAKSSSAEQKSKPATSTKKADFEQEMLDLLRSAEFRVYDSTIDRFLSVLSHLYLIAPEAFAHAADIRGRSRVYFSQSESELLSNGKTTKPKLIPQTNYWVITNTNTGRKKAMVTQVMAAMGFSHKIIEKVVKAL